MSNQADPSATDTRLGSANLVALFYEHRKRIILICSVAFLISAVISLIIPEKYKSTVVMFPAAYESLGMMLTNEEVNKDILRYGDREEAERLIQLIQSDEVREAIIEKYGLYKHYDIDPEVLGSKTLIIKEYYSNINASLTRFGSVEVSVMDLSPDTATYIANDISVLIDSIDGRLRRERALEALSFAKEEHAIIKERIRLLEDSMAVLRDRGVYDYFTQIPALTEMYASAIAEGHPDRAAKLKAEMDNLGSMGHSYNSVSKAIDAAYTQERFLRARHDQLMIDYTNRLPVKFVVNKALIPDKKSYPVRWLIVVMSVASAFFLTVVVLLVQENIRNVRAGR